jgi:hypothetical protein
MIWVERGKASCVLLAQLVCPLHRRQWITLAIPQQIV